MSPLRRRRGFTLIEIMVVIVIIGVIVTIATVSLEGLGRDDTLPEERDRLHALLRLAGDRAMIEGNEYGLHMSRDAYRFLRYRDEGWQAAPGREFRRREWPESVLPELVMDGSSVDLEAYDEDESTPQLLVTATGESTPFRLILRQRGEIDGLVLEGRADGALRRWQEEDGPPQGEDQQWSRQ